MRPFYFYLKNRTCRLFPSFLPKSMPDGEKPVIPPPPAIHIEQTLALIKPDAIDKSDEIEEIILLHGFTILQVMFLIYLNSIVLFLELSIQ